jgi:SAM-dependent methyltransferase
MEIRRIWQKLRGVVPVSCYPLLAPVYRWDRRRTIRRLERQDAGYLASHPEVIVPGAELRFNVVGAIDIPGFLEGGRRTAEDIEAALARTGASIDRVGRALDFGCGCGRLLLETVRRWPHVRWAGSDVDERAIQWCAAHLPEAKILVNQPLPPLPFANGEFDLIWCGSVFTHLDEGRQDAWLGELRRTLAPGGYLLASVHGSNCWAGLPRPTVRRIQERGFVFARTGGDEGIHPEWYQAAWHTRDYIDSHWSQFVEVAAYIPIGSGAQDVVVGRRRAG